MKNSHIKNTSVKKSSIALFCLRLFLYFSVIVIIFIHPGVSVAFDRIGIIQWFFIIPLMAVAAFIPEHVLKPKRKLITIGLLFIVLSSFAGRIGIGLILQFAIAALVSYALTSILFRYPQWGKFASIEPFFLAWVSLRLLSLSRSGEEIAGQSAVLTQFILVWTAVIFLLHCAVIYFCLYPQSRAGVYKEGAAFFAGAAGALVLLLLILPVDFIRNTIVENLVSERVPEIIRPSETDRDLTMRRTGRNTIPGSRNRSSELRGVSEHNWQGSSDGSDESRQYMIKVVASEIEPVYMGESFRGHLDPVLGFQLSADEPLNELIRQRLFITWSNNERERDLDRKRTEVFSLSTLQQKYLPYRPVVVDPTILNEDAGPLRYIHQVVSSMHIGDPLYLVNEPTRLLTNHEKSMLASYLEVPLEENDREIFRVYLNNALKEWQTNRNSIIRNDFYLRMFVPETSGNEYLEIILALLTGFSQFQYNLNPDDFSVAALKEFLFETKEGDCVEFSNSLALLGRLAGIPSRVVTGYMASEQLQTQAHQRGLAVLRNGIPALQKFPFENLYLITNLHSHSWTQFYIPNYGWLDFEATSFSIPPEGMGDFNNWDVVIPILDKNRTLSQVRKFPWRAVGRALLTLALLAVICAYMLRYIRELILYMGTQRGSVRVRARSLYLLLLARLAAEGKPIKPASKTAHEYSELFAEGEPLFVPFADLYSELRWRQFTDKTEADKRFEQLTIEYQNILNAVRRRGLHNTVKRIFSLRGLAYL
ncbi:MAG: transglutaminase-like domain-containing protein [Treponema sp.]|nr:transglutaminase-like domain-containing protein [Treponema sp.]